MSTSRRVFCTLCVAFVLAALGATVARLPLYHRSLVELLRAKTATVSSETLAELTGCRDPRGAPFATDGGELEAAGIRSVICGPGELEQAHRPDESLPISHLRRGSELIREVVDTGTTNWGPVYYLLEYAPQDKRDALMKDPRIAFDDPKTQARPHIQVMAGGPSQVAAEKPLKAAPVAVAQPKAEAPIKAEAAPAPKKEEAPVAASGSKKPKAAHNDDPS
jgi:hypothetical protein